MADELQVDVWSDVMCPWCAIGWTQFSKAIDVLKGEVDVTARFMPFELNPDAPPEGQDQAQVLAANYGKSLEEVAAMGRVVEDAAEKAGFPMDWRGEGDAPPKRVWNTRSAHMLLRWALAVADPQAQVRLKEAFLRAHFQQRLNVSDRDVLLDIAQEQGFDRAAAAAALDDPALSQAIAHEEDFAARNGIRSVPTFVVNGKYILQGSSEPENFRQALVKLASMEAMA